MPSLTEKEGEADPLATIAARALVLGCLGSTRNGYVATDPRVG